MFHQGLKEEKCFLREKARNCWEVFGCCVNKESLVWLMLLESWRFERANSCFFATNINISRFSISSISLTVAWTFLTTMSEWSFLVRGFVIGKSHVLTLEPQSCFWKNKQSANRIESSRLESSSFSGNFGWFFFNGLANSSFCEVICVRKVLSFVTGTATVVVQTCQECCLFWVILIGKIISPNNYCLNALIKDLVSKFLLLGDFWVLIIRFCFHSWIFLVIIKKIFFI